MAYYISDSDSDDDYWMFSSTDEEDDIPLPIIPRVKRGRKALVETFAELAPTVEKFINDNSAQAHDRRREATSYSNGVSLEDIRRHVQSTVPGISSISRNTIHRMMKAPRAKTHNAKRYKGIVDARVPPKKNNLTNVHPDFRYTCAAVNYAMELSSLFDDECLMLSCDDKNKINVGSLSVSRHFQIKRFFSDTDQPNYPDHDFPYPDSKLIPSGYMQLSLKKRRSRSLTRPRKSMPNYPIRRRTQSLTSYRLCKKTTVDTIGRKRVSWPRTGPLDVFLQASKFHSSTSQSHASHLHQILQPIVFGKVNPPSVVTLLVDGGPDWTTKSTVNLVNYGRLWRDLCLDGLILIAYAPRHSRQNPVERAWAPLSRWLTGVTLPRTLPGETLPPYQQSGLTDEEVVRKEEQIFDQAIDRCRKYWNGKKIDSFPVTVHKIPCRQSPSTLYQDHDKIKLMNTASMKKINEDSTLQDLRKELRFFTQHAVRRTYQIEFYKCTRIECGHCSSAPIKAENFFTALSTMGGKLPSPVPDPSRRFGEYSTLLRLLDIPEYISPKLDNQIPSGAKMTCNRGCDYLFSSIADRQRHQKLIHGD